MPDHVPPRFAESRCQYVTVGDPELDPRRPDGIPWHNSNTAAFLTYASRKRDSICRKHGTFKSQRRRPRESGASKWGSTRWIPACWSERRSGLLALGGVMVVMNYLSQW